MAPSSATPPGAPRDDAPIVGIAGGRGGIGSLFARLFEAAGLTVLVSDLDTALDNAGLAARSDLALVATPLRVTPRVLAEMAAHVRPDAALVSLGSLMEPALPALTACRGESFLLHPLFGPGRTSLRGATLALAPLRIGPRGEWLLRLLGARGARIVVTTPHEHDQTMAVAQALMHGVYATLTPEIVRALPGAASSLGTSPAETAPEASPLDTAPDTSPLDTAPDMSPPKTIPDTSSEAAPGMFSVDTLMGLSLPDTSSHSPLDWATPTLRLQLALMSRILHQDPRLYGDLLALNRYTPAALDRLIGRLQGLRDAVQAGPNAVAALFAAARADLGPHGPILAAEGDRALGES